MQFMASAENVKSGISDLEVLLNFFNTCRRRQDLDPISEKNWKEKCHHIESLTKMKNVQNVSSVLIKLTSILKLEGNFDIIYDADVSKYNY